MKPKTLVGKNDCRRGVCDKYNRILSLNANTKARSIPWTGFFTHSKGEILLAVYDNGVFAYLERLDAVDSVSVSCPFTSSSFL